MKNGKALCFCIALVLFVCSNTCAANLGLYGFNINTNLYDTLNLAIDKGFRIKVYGSNVNPDFAARLFQLSYQYEIANDNTIDKHFEGDRSLYRIITNTDEIKYAKGFNVYNFLNEKGEKVGSFIFDNNLMFISKNKYDFNIIPVKIYKENITIDMIFYEYQNSIYKPLFIAVSFFKLESVRIAIKKLNERFGDFKEIIGENISARYWNKDGTSVSNYFGLNDRFVFYNINTIKEFNKRESLVIQKIKSSDTQLKDNTQESLQKLHDDM